MRMSSCFGCSWKPKKSKGRNGIVVPCENKNGKSLLESKTSVAVPFGIPGCNVKVVNDEALSMRRVKEDGHVSDPGGGKVEFWASPKLKRSSSCRDVVEEFLLCGDDGSPMTQRSADNHSGMWVALPLESSPFRRVEEWVKGISFQTDDIVYPAESASPPTASIHLNLPHANSVIQSLNENASSSISGFSSLRSVNLSANFIVHIAPGSLPKGLHVLNLSRNRINTIEGLRELTRLRVLDLSYNRISRISQGLSNCILIKQLYLSGNKISHVQGLHRLLKLTILDLSFNKITTTKALAQLVANYNSLISLNLLGNPIQCNDQLRKTVCSLLPKVAFLNKQPVNTQKAREVGADAKAALTRRKSASARRHNAAAAHKGKLRLTKTFPQHHSALKHRTN